MPFTAPSLDDVRNQLLAIAAVQTFRDRNGVVVTPGPIRPTSVLSTLVEVMATAAHGAHRHVDAAMKDAVPVTATGTALSDWGTTLGVPRKPAQFAQLEATFTGVDTSIVPAGTRVQHVDTGQTFATLEAVTIASGSALAEIQAEAAGPGGTLSDGTTVQLVQTVAGVDNTATTGTILQVGADVEADEDLRARIVDFTSSRPNGANEAYYRAQALEVPAVTRAWAEGSLTTAGTVLLWAVADDLSPITLPAALIAAIEANTPPPVGTTLSVQSAALSNLDPQIALSPNTPAVQASVSAALEAMLVTETRPGKTIPLSKIRQAVSNASGEDDSSVTVPAADFTVASNEIVVLGTPVYSDL